MSTRIKHLHDELDRIAYVLRESGHRAESRQVIALANAISVVGDSREIADALASSSPDWSRVLLKL